MCRTGPDAEGLGRDHWNEMLAYPRKPITHWHALCEVRRGCQQFINLQEHLSVCDMVNILNMYKNEQKVGQSASKV